MYLKNQKSRLRVWAVLLLLSILACAAAPVRAAGDVHSLEGDLSALNREQERLDSEIRSITAKIRDANGQITQIREELAMAKEEETARYEAMKTRIKYMYENGNTDFLEMLFTSASLADFIRRAEYISAITEYDRSALKELSEARRSIAEKEQQLTEERQNLDSLLAALDQKAAELNEKIHDTSAALETARKEAEEAQKALQKKIEAAAPPKETEPSHAQAAESYVPTATDLELFAALIECEAGSSNYEGMLAVACVVVNRMQHPGYPDTLRGVILQSGQFPPAHNGKVDRILKRGVKKACLQAAQDALNGKNNIGGCLSFRSAGSGHTGTVVGSNVFF